MPKPSRFDRLDQAIQQMLSQRKAAAPPAKGAATALASLVRIADDLRNLPREEFKAQLKSDLQRRAAMENAAKPAVDSGSAQKPPETLTGYRTIAPYIIVPKAADFIEFLTKAFDAKERFRVPIQPGSRLLMHAEVQLGNCVIELADSSEQVPPAPQAIHLYFDDADSVYQRAIDAGATSIYPVGDHVSGDRQGAVRDPFGNIWYIAMIQGWTPGPEGVPSVQPYLHLHGSQKMLPFLENAFAGMVSGHVPTSPEGHVLHATVQIGNTTLEVDEAHGEFQPMPCHLHLHIDDADAMYARAIRAGAESISAPENKPYGRSGGVKDPFGNSWYLTSPLATQLR